MKKKPKAMKRTVKKLKKKTVVKAKKRVTTAKKKVAKIAKPKVLGKVEHYYDKIGVAIVRLVTPVAVGDTVSFRRNAFTHTQFVQSLQIDHVQVPRAKKGDVIGMKVDREVPNDSLMMPV